MKHRRLLAITSLVSACCLLIGLNLSWAQDENETVGFRSNHIFESGQFGENIDVLNGGLTLTTPIGQKFRINSALGYGLTLSYSSRVWDSAYFGSSDMQSRINQVVPTSKGPFGIGFRMHFGRIHREQHYIKESECYQGDGVHYWPCYRSTWIWESPDGTQHEFLDDPNIKNPAPDLGPGLVIPSTGASGNVIPAGLFNGRMTDDLSYTIISGPNDEFCIPTPDNGTNDQTACFRVKTPDGLVYTLSKMVDCTNPPNLNDADPNNPAAPTPLQYQTARSDNDSFCGWYTTLIEDSSTGTRVALGMYPNHVKIAYDMRTNFQHLISRVTDSTGRTIKFKNCEWAEQANPAEGFCNTTTSLACNTESNACPPGEVCYLGHCSQTMEVCDVGGPSCPAGQSCLPNSPGDIVDRCLDNTHDEDPNPLGATSRSVAATYAVQVPEPGRPTRTAIPICSTRISRYRPPEMSTRISISTHDSH